MTESAPDTTTSSVGSAEPTDSVGATSLTGTAIMLLNYIDALQEYLQDGVPNTQAASSHDDLGDLFAARLSAMHALRSIKWLLQRVGHAKPVDTTEFIEVLNDSHARFVRAGLLTSDCTRPFSEPAAPQTDTGNRSWCVPEWCIMKLYEGVNTLIRPSTGLSRTSSQTQPDT
jgi:hypothetical protein